MDDDDDVGEGKGEGREAKLLPYRVTATRALKQGEELTVDYTTLSWRGLREGERPPAPVVGSPGFVCDCCGKGVFR